MSVPLLDLDPQHQPLKAEFLASFESLLDSGHFVLGQAVTDFESSLAEYLGIGHVVGVSSGTDAILAALMANGIGQGDQVITTPFTFIATASSIARLGAQPKFVDIRADTFNLDPQGLDAALTSQTKAIIPVHLYGHSCEIRQIVDYASSRELAVIEDTAQGIGALDGHKKLGTFGDVGCFSFYPTKNLSALGDAGACVTDSPQLAEKLRQLRQHGESKRYHHQVLGGNFRIDALQAAFLSIKLRYVDNWNDQRRECAARYGQMLSGLPIRLPVEAAASHHIYHQYTIRVEGGERDRLANYLLGKGIGHAIHYPVPLHLQPCFSAYGGRRGEFPVAEQAAKEVLSLPVYPGLSIESQQEVADTIKEFYR